MLDLQQKAGGVKQMREERFCSIEAARLLSSFFVWFGLDFWGFFVRGFLGGFLVFLNFILVLNFLGFCFVLYYSS